MACLSTSEIEQYRSEGWLIPQYSLPQSRVAQMFALGVLRKWLARKSLLNPSCRSVV